MRDHIGLRRLALLAPEVIAQEIVEDLQAALDEFAAIAEALGGEVKPEATAEETTASES